MLCKWDDHIRPDDDRAWSDITCALGPLTAGPFLRLSILKCIPEASMMRPIIPSNASISLTKWPFPIPPIDGLQLISPTDSRRWVTRIVSAPARADAAAASQPACPPPIIITSAERDDQASEDLMNTPKSLLVLILCEGRTLQPKSPKDGLTHSIVQQFIKSRDVRIYQLFQGNAIFIAPWPKIMQSLWESLDLEPCSCHQSGHLAVLMLLRVNVVHQSDGDELLVSFLCFVAGTLKWKKCRKWPYDTGKFFKGNAELKPHFYLLCTH